MKEKMKAFKYFARQLVSAKMRLELWQTFFKIHIMYGLESFFVDEPTLNQIKGIYFYIHNGVYTKMIYSMSIKRALHLLNNMMVDKCPNLPLNARKQLELQTDLDNAIHHPALQAQVSLTLVSICEDETIGEQLNKLVFQLMRTSNENLRQIINLHNMKQLHERVIG